MCLRRYQCFFRVVGVPCHYVSAVSLDEAKLLKHMKNQGINEYHEERYDLSLSNPFSKDSWRQQTGEELRVVASATT